MQNIIHNALKYYSITYAKNSYERLLNKYVESSSNDDVAKSKYALSFE